MSKKNRPGSGRQERYIQASILLGLVSAPSYGYELISTIQSFGFIQGTAPPGMIYRHLRQMEEDNLVRSEWETKEAGAAKRTYTITDEGREVLDLWIQVMQTNADRLNKFIGMFQEKTRLG
ncbi:MAG: helix-turn-helix transcriptional regulator [Desulfobacter sp.]|nr:MAG: helix-turn-helix transcriptional regulator [Desulfobacter sp.]